ncbi:Hha/YmoA family nucleoid-associated regulatory protein [Rahnella laticis]|uniref:Hha/YmoA family nucleoid-associated regulatory protein n=1 Tax=Rahnella laticis TaxID=2787622 RepID=UPI0018A30B1D|nr:Hha/YmoA family nucleoid-associated regulatory protein [Rahnella laticis]MBF7997488.1 hypothetical protein [Rahnella laticis]
MTKMDFLLRLRRCSKLDTLELVVSHQREHMSREWVNEFELAADHRRAEIITGKLFDRVPRTVWRLLS